MPVIELSNVTTTASLLTNISTQLTTRGWTQVYYNAALEQLGVSKGNSFIALGTQLNAAGTGLQSIPAYTQLISGGAIQDKRMWISVNYSLNATNQKYYDHPGRTGTEARTNQFTGATNREMASINWINPPFPKVFIFTDTTATFMHVAIELPSESSTTRYQFISFGTLDIGDLQVPRPTYAAGSVQNIREEAASVAHSSYTANSLEQDELGFFAHNQNLILMSTFGSENPTHATLSSDDQLVESDFVPTFYPDDTTSGDVFSSTVHTNCRYLNHMQLIENKTYPGGIWREPIPVFYRQARLEALYMGTFPGVYLCKLGTELLATERTYDGRRFYVFPIKQKGLSANTKTGASPTKLPNSGDYGYAFEVL